MSLVPADNRAIAAKPPRSHSGFPQIGAAVTDQFDPSVFCLPSDKVPFQSPPNPCSSLTHWDWIVPAPRFRPPQSRRTARLVTLPRRAQAEVPPKDLEAGLNRHSQGFRAVETGNTPRESQFFQNILTEK